MPNLDQTGPEGLGPRTGREAGDCQPAKSDNSRPLSPRPRRRRPVGRGHRA